LENRFGSKPNDASDTGLPSLVLAGTSGTVTNGFSTNGFTFSFVTLPGLTYDVVASTNLNLPGTNWPRPTILTSQTNPLIRSNGTNALTNTITDTSATNSTRKFYQIKISPSP